MPKGYNRGKSHRRVYRDNPAAYKQAFEQHCRRMTFRLLDGTVVTGEAISTATMYLRSKAYLPMPGDYEGQAAIFAELGLSIARGYCLGTGRGYASEQRKQVLCHVVY